MAVTGELVERHPSRDVFYVAGSAGLFRIDRQGALSSADPSIGEGEIRAIGLSSDGALLYAYERGGDSASIHVLDAGSMELAARIDSSIEVQAFVPLDGAGRTLAIGTPAERPFRGPVWVAEVDARAGRLGPVRAIADGLRAVEFSATSPWARVDHNTILVPSTYGVVTVNLSTGEARVLPESAFEGLDPCCAIAWDPDRSRLYVTEHAPFREANGRVVVYEPTPPELLSTTP